MKSKTRIEQKEETRKLILKTARRMFFENNYYKTTIRDIAQNAGIAAGTIFSHFPNKPALLAATLIDDVETVLEDSAKTVPFGADLIEMIVHPIKELYEHFAGISDLSKIWIKETMFMEGEWGERVSAQLERSRLIIKQVLDEAQNKGNLKQGSDCDLLSKGAMSHYSYVLIIGLQQNLSVQQQVELFTGLIKNLLAEVFYQA